MAHRNGVTRTPGGRGASTALGLAVALAWISGCGIGERTPDGPTPAGPAGEGARSSSAPPEADYWVYVGAESADLIHRVRFGPDGAEVELTTPIGRFPTVTEGPHGLVVSPDGRYLYMTTGHGAPDGMLWKFELGPDTLVAEPIPLDRFPATIDITPDGLYVFAVNFNLYGAHVPSTMSVAYTPDFYEVHQIELCTMPHGSRMSPSGHFVYTVCMMDDLVVEVDTRSFEVSRKFSVAEGREGPVEAGPLVAATRAGPGDHDHDERPAGAQADPHDAEHHQENGINCSPTWALPSPDGSRLFVSCNAADLVHEIDVEGWKLARTFETGRGPYNLAVTPNGQLLIVTLKQGNAVEFIELETGASRARVPTSTTVVHGVTISPDGRYAFVSVEGVRAEPGKVDIFDLRSLERVADVAVGQQASGIDFWRMEAR